MLEVTCSIPATGEEKFRCRNMLSIMTFAGMTLNKCTLLRIRTLTWGPLGKESHPCQIRYVNITLRFAPLGTGPDFGSSDFIGSLRGQSENGMLSDPHNGVNSLDLILMRLKLVANDRSDKRFLLISKFCPLGLSAPDLRLYTFIKSWKDV